MDSTENDKKRLAELQHQAQQPRLAAEADIKPDMKTVELTEGAEADEGDILSARVDKLWCLIRADVQVVYAAVHFWEGARVASREGSFGTLR